MSHCKGTGSAKEKMKQEPGSWLPNPQPSAVLWGSIVGCYEQQPGFF